MSKTITLLVPFEVTTQGLTDAVLQKAWKGQPVINDPDMLAVADHERRLVDALLASPALLEEFLRAHLAEYFSGLHHTDAYKLTGVSRESQDVLQEVIQQLPEQSRIFFEEAHEGGIFYENTMLVYDSFPLVPQPVALEHGQAAPQGPTSPAVG